MRRTSFVIAMALLASVGCAIVDNTGPDTGDFDVRTTGTHVLMSNGLDSPIYFFAVGRQISVLVDWIPHLDDDHSVAPGSSVALPYDDILLDSETPETQVIVYWWRATMRDGKRVPGTMTSEIVDL